MNRRHASAAVVLGSAVVLLATACGPSNASSSAAASGSPASTAPGSAAPSGLSSQASTSAPSSTPDGSATGGSAATGVPGAPAAATTRAGATTGAATGASSGWKPCYLPAGYADFFKLDSAETYQGKTVVRVTPETCKVNKNDDEDVQYTPIDAARSFTVGSGATVKVLGSDSTTPHAVAPSWLVKNKPVDGPYFYYNVNGQNEITAMQEIYHP